jgi:hypothetical protein
MSCVACVICTGMWGAFGLDPVDGRPSRCLPSLLLWWDRRLCFYGDV